MVLVEDFHQSNYSLYICTIQTVFGCLNDIEIVRSYEAGTAGHTWNLYPEDHPKLCGSRWTIFMLNLLDGIRSLC